jgi:hypothetical protein
MARPEKLTDEVLERVCEALRAGASFRLAARHAGISRASLHRWERRGTDPDAPTRFQDFARAVAHARAAREALIYARVRRKPL